MDVVRLAGSNQVNWVAARFGQGYNRLWSKLCGHGHKDEATGQKIERGQITMRQCNLVITRTTLADLIKAQMDLICT